MKILVAIPSFRPLPLLNVIQTAWRLRSGQNRIEFITCHEDNDIDMENARRFFAEYADDGCILHVTTESAETCSTIGGKWNAILSTGPARSADIVTFLGDKTIPVTRQWDTYIREAWDEDPKRLMWWVYPNEILKCIACCLPIIPRSILDACDGPLVPDLFPFWYVDGWLEELTFLLHGYPHFIPIETAGHRGTTYQGRDFAFWHRVYHAMVEERIKQAEGIRKKLGIPHHPDYEEALKHTRWTSRLQVVSTYNDSQVADTSPPSELYLKKFKLAREMFPDVSTESVPSIDRNEPNLRTPPKIPCPPPYLQKG